MELTAAAKLHFELSLGFLCLLEDFLLLRGSLKESIPLLSQILTKIPSLDSRSYILSATNGRGTLQTRPGPSDG